MVPMRKKTATSQEINELAHSLARMHLPRITGFSDMVVRKMENAGLDPVSLVHIHVLNFLIMRGGDQGVTHGELARLMIRSNHSITRLVDALERDGLVRRHRDDNDRRAVYVRLTAAGMQLMRAHLKAVAELERQVLVGLSAAELEGLTTTLRKVRANIQAIPVRRGTGKRGAAARSR